MDYRDRIRAIINHATGCPENWCPDDRRCVELVDEMADEIERLSAEVVAWRERFKGYVGFDGQTIVTAG